MAFAINAPDQKMVDLFGVSLNKFFILFLVLLASSEASAAGQTAVFAGGCFWGVDAVFKHVKGVSDVTSGYAGGNAATAHYELVSMGNTGHAESVRVHFDPDQVSYDQLLQVFFNVAHDPTELNRQGPDTGTQYRSAIFYTSAEQQKSANEYIKMLSKKGTSSRKSCRSNSSILQKNITRITLHCIQTSLTSYTTTCQSWLN
jgi:peptide-methionine (S)-S-oxide reductase